MARNGWLLRAFPRGWRARHAEEFSALLDEMRSENGGRLTTSHRVDILLSGVSVRIDVLRRYRRHRLLLPVCAVAVCLAIAGIVAGSLAGPVSRPASPPVASRLYATPARVRPDAAMLDDFLPTSGSQFAAGEEYSEFMRIAEARSTNRCLAAKGIQPVPARPGTYGGDNMQFPDIAYLSTYGFSNAVAPVSKLIADRSPNRTPAEKEAVDACSSASSAAFNAFDNEGRPLVAAWMPIAIEVGNDAAFKKALKEFSSCLAASGIHTTTITGFFRYATPETRLSGTPAAAQRSLGALYARCIAPAEAIRDKARAAALVNFERSHSATISQLIHNWNTLLASAESAGTPWPSPTGR